MAKTSYTAVLSVIDRVTAPLRKLQKSFRPLKTAFKDIGDASGRLTSALGGVMAPLSAVFGAAGLGSMAAVASKIVGTSAEFEKFQTVLETIEGSAEKAKSSMAWVQDFAAKTPYELAGVTDAFVRLKSYGIDPQGGALRAAGDAAAAMGKPLEQAVEALADAMTGENERLKEFGITASAQGDKIAYRWQENGKSMVAIADKNSKAMIQKTIEGIWNGRYGGAMDKLSDTWAGMWSNLQDSFTKFFKMIGDAGIFDVLKGELKGVLSTLSAMEADGSLKVLAQTISDGLVSSFRELKSWVMAVDWKGVWSDLKSFGTAVLDVGRALGGLKGVAIIFAALFAASAVTSVLSLGLALVSFGAMIAPVLGAAGTAFAGLAVAMGPIGWIVAAIAGAGLLLYANWDSVGPWFAGLWASIQVGAEAFWGWIKNAISFSPLGLIASRWGALMGFFSGLWDRLKGPLLAAWDLFKTVLGFTPLGLIVSSWEPLTGYFSGLWDRLKGPLLAAWELFKMVLGFTPLGLIANSWEPLVGYFSGLWDRLKGFIEPITSAAGAVGDFFAGGSGQSGPATPTHGRFGVAGQQSLKGQMVVTFEGAPPGMKVTSGKSNQPGVAMEADVGYRSLALP